MEEKKRMFKLRNGGIIRELGESKILFAFVEALGGHDENGPWAEGEVIHLCQDDEGGPITGGAFGPNYDIIEELFDEGGEG